MPTEAGVCALVTEAQPRMVSTSGRMARARLSCEDIGVLPSVLVSIYPGRDAKRDGWPVVQEYVCIPSASGSSYSSEYVCRSFAIRLLLRSHRVQHLRVPRLEKVLECLPAHGRI